MAVSTEKKVQVVELMEAGYRGRDAVDEVGVDVTEMTAYIWRKKWREGGEAALEDKRHGYRYKMTDEIRAWLKQYCESEPDTSSSVLQTEIQEQFGVEVTRRHINNVRAELGVRRPKKTRTP